MRHLYLQIYVALVAILIVFLFLMSMAWWLLRDRDDRIALDGLALLVSEVVPAQTASPGEIDASINRLSEMFSARITLRAQDGTLLSHAGEALPAPPPDWQGSGVRHLRGTGPVATLRLPDGRWIVATRDHQHRRGGLLFAILLLAFTIAVGAYPVVRRITRRLENLQTSVDALGAGALDARVRVEGKDEVANLASSFNRAAERIEKLVNSQRQMLATASHELRSPLTRMRMALELLERENRPELRDQLKKDIAELDDLVGEILLATRLQAIEELERSAPVDLLALLVEEASRFGATVSGDAATVHGDARLLRRMIRNLLDNAQRHSGGSEVKASVESIDDATNVLRVEDRGPGIPEQERERIFEPFYRVEGTRETGEGFGLGLALVRQIAQRHGGDVRCLSRPGGGTRFEVTLPVEQSRQD
ncbi:MAG: HAMP domain-containing histidine kinase [Betaproteobacteria bacterium]|nr:MAG: HAMP domain-containing histidine kinase [Betaproteobacteria bacterium]